jgi:hypothetical protein
VSVGFRSLLTGFTVFQRSDRLFWEKNWICSKNRVGVHWRNYLRSTEVDSQSSDPEVVVSLGELMFLVMIYLCLTIYLFISFKKNSNILGKFPLFLEE